MCGFRYIQNLTSYYALHGAGNVFYVFCSVNIRIWVTELADSVQSYRTIDSVPSHPHHFIEYNFLFLCDV